MHRRLLPLLVLGALALPADAHACSIAAAAPGDPPPGDPGVELRQARKAIVGRVTSVRGTVADSRVTIIVRVEETLKGPRGREWIRLRSSADEGTCGIGLETGDRAGVTLRERDTTGRWLVGILDRHGPAELRRAARRQR